MATYLDLVKRAWLNMGLSGSPPPDVTKAQGMHKRACEWVREADLHIQQLHYNWVFRWKFKQSRLKVGQAEYDLDELGVSDFSHLIQPSIGDDASPVAAVKWAPMYLMPFDPLSVYNSGKPNRLCFTPARKWAFNAIPDKNYWVSFEYYRTPKELTGNFDVPLIPDEWQHVIIHRAKMLYALYDESATDLTEAKMEYESTLVRMESKFLPPVKFVEDPFTKAVV